MERREREEIEEEKRGGRVEVGRGVGGKGRKESKKRI